MDKQEKLKRFANDPVMREAVYEVLLNSFLKKGPNADVYEKASRFIAIGNLGDAWREIERLRVDGREDNKQNPTKHV